MYRTEAPLKPPVLITVIFAFLTAVNLSSLHKFKFSYFYFHMIITLYHYTHYTHKITIPLYCIYRFSTQKSLLMIKLTLCRYIKNHNDEDPICTVSSYSKLTLHIVTWYRMCVHLRSATESRWVRSTDDLSKINNIYKIILLNNFTKPDSLSYKYCKCNCNC